MESDYMNKINKEEIIFLFTAGDLKKYLKNIPDETKLATYGADIDASAIDNDVNKGGRQITLYVQVKVPVATTAGNYSTQYGIRTQ